MPFVEPPSMRSTVEEGPEGLSFVIPARRRKTALLVAPFGLAAWGVGGYDIVGRGSFFGSNYWWIDTLFLLTWIGGGVFASRSWLWSMFGRERVTADFGLLTHRFEVLGLSRTTCYDVTAIKNLRYSPIPINMWGTRDERYWRWGGGDIAFDYGSKPVRFGAVDEPEGRIIIERLSKRLRLTQSEPAPEPGTVDSPESAAFWGRGR